MKSYPANWNTAQLAFFAGLISSRISIGELKKTVDELALGTRSDSPSIYFTRLVGRLEPRISISGWEGTVETCERLFK